MEYNTKGNRLNNHRPNIIMAKIKVSRDGYSCERCGHIWVPRKKGEPRVCPKCKSPYWNTPRKGKKN